MKRLVAGIAVGVLVLLAVLGAPMLVAIVSMLTATQSAPIACRPSPAAAGQQIPGRDGQGSFILTAAQLEHAATMMTVAAQLEVPRQGMLIALTVGLQESTLRNLANESQPASLELPNDGVGSDHDSVGITQARPSAGWGSVEDLMTPSYAWRAFFGGDRGPNQGSPAGLLDIPDWQQLDPGAAAQRVQVSAYPDAYAEWVAAASAILEIVAGSCAPIAAGSIAAPVDDYPYAAMTDGRPAMSPTTALGNPAGQCVDFIYWRMNRDAGYAAAPWQWDRHDVVSGAAGAGDAWRLASSIWPQQWGISPAATPQPGWIAAFPPYRGGAGSVGHVGYVQAVLPDGSIVLEDYNGFGGVEAYAATTLSADFLADAGVVYLPMLWMVPSTGFGVAA